MRAVTRCVNSEQPLRKGPGADYHLLAQKHIAMASQKIDKVGGRIDSLQAFCAVPRADARHTLHPSHVQPTQLGLLPAPHGMLRSISALSGWV